MTRMHTALLAFIGLAFAGLTSANSFSDSFDSILEAQWPLGYTPPVKDVYRLSSVAKDGPTEVKMMSDNDGLMSPKILPVNGSAYDLWYFDVVAMDSFASVVVIFYNTAPGMFPFVGSPDSTLIVSLAITYPNGTLTPIAVTSRLAHSATIVGEDNGSSGEWHGTGFSWEYNAATGAYNVIIDAPEIDVKGTIHMAPIGPPRYPCGNGESGVNMEIVPLAGYSNALPDALSTVDLMVHGTRHAFTGSGYLDQGWGAHPFADAVTSWYWGHGRVGPYSVVWFNILSPNGAEYASAYLSKTEGNELITNNCDLKGSRTRAVGKTATGKTPEFPPHYSLGHPTEYLVTMDLGEQGTLELNVSVVQPLIAVPIYQRSVSHLSGTIIPVGGERGEVMKGVAMLEEFVLQE